MDKDNVMKAVMEVLNAFTQQEMGNKISQFGMTGLAQVIDMKLQELYKDVENFNHKEVPEEG